MEKPGVILERGLERSLTAPRAWSSSYLWLLSQQCASKGTDQHGSGGDSEWIS